MNHGSLFSGIGGFDLAAEWMGWQNIFHVEQNPWCRQVLNHQFPNTDSHEDVTQWDHAQYRDRIDILTGGFPCQPFSLAGKRKGMEDARWLWPEMFTAIVSIRPTWVIAENVRGLLTMANGKGEPGMVFEKVCADLENEGFTVWPFLCPAAATGAPHRRDRIWVIAFNAHNAGRRAGSREIPEANGKVPEWDNGAESGHTDALSHTDHAGSRNPVRNDGNGPQEIRRGFPQSECGPDGIDGDATNTKRIRPQRGGNRVHPVCDEACQRQTEIHSGHRVASHGGGTGLQSGQGPDGREEYERKGDHVWNPSGSAEQGRDAAHTDGAGIRQNLRGGKSGQHDQTRQGTDWKTWPTVSPVCDGNDGLPGELDGITFSKWRRETIKAAGNAIVPQVAFNIFQSIARFNALR